MVSVVVAKAVHNGGSEMFHVHGAGCKDLSTKGKYHAGEMYEMEVASKNEVVFDMYPPDDFGYDAEVPAEVAGYAMDFKFFPCVDL